MSEPWEIPTFEEIAASATGSQTWATRAELIVVARHIQALERATPAREAKTENVSWTHEAEMEALGRDAINRHGGALKILALHDRAERAERELADARDLAARAVQSAETRIANLTSERDEAQTQRADWRTAAKTHLESLRAARASAEKLRDEIQWVIDILPTTPDGCESNPIRDRLQAALDQAAGS